MDVEFDFNKIGYTAIPNWIDDTFMNNHHTYQACFRFLIKNANKSEKPNHRYINNVLVIEEQFEYAFTTSYASKALGITDKTWRTFINNLLKVSIDGLKVINRKSTNKYTLIKLCFPVVFMHQLANNGQTTGNQKSNKSQAEGKQRATTKETNKLINKKTNKLLNNNNNGENFSKKNGNENYWIAEDLEREIDNHPLIYQYPNIKSFFINEWLKWFEDNSKFKLHKKTIQLHLNDLQRSLEVEIAKEIDVGKLLEYVKRNLETAIKNQKLTPYPKFNYNESTTNTNWHTSTKTAKRKRDPFAEIENKYYTSN